MIGSLSESLALYTAGFGESHVVPIAMQNDVITAAAAPSCSTSIACASLRWASMRTRRAHRLLPATDILTAMMGVVVLAGRLMICWLGTAAAALKVALCPPGASTCTDLGAGDGWLLARTDVVFVSRRLSAPFTAAMLRGAEGGGGLSTRGGGGGDGACCEFAEGAMHVLDGAEAAGTHE